jgi:hypothetical protein
MIDHFLCREENQVLMTSKYHILISFFVILISITSYFFARSPYRTEDLHDPLIHVWSSQDPAVYQFRESHLEESVFWLFDRNHFFQHLLPDGPISYRSHPEKTVLGTTLSILVKEAVNEIISLKPGYKPTFSSFKVLKMRDINRTDHTGLYILKFNNYPFVVKIFIESPKNFFRPGNKGFETACFYYMGGGVNRHLTGFTRIKNLEEIQEIVQKDSHWSQRLSFLRKWFWLPEKPIWITFRGYNIGPYPCIQATIPAIYAIICNEIEWERTFSMKNYEDRKEAISLSNFLSQRIDLHINNFVIERETGKLIIIDYEHFPSVVGIKETRRCSGYFQWYSTLVCKMLHDTLGRNKYQRRCIQQSCYSPFHFTSNIPDEQKRKILLCQD